jgi:hypothetical protein
MQISVLAASSETFEKPYYRGELQTTWKMTCLNVKILFQLWLQELRNAKWEEKFFCKIKVLLWYSHVRIKKFHGNANYETRFQSRFQQ